MRRILAALAALATLWVLPACAQTVLQAPSIKYGGIFLTPPPGTLIVYDSITGFPCILGSTATCTLSAGGGGGGAVTLAAGSVAAGAYVSGSLLSGAVVDLINIETTAGGAAPPKAASVQGIAGGTALPITGSLSNASDGVATSSTNIGTNSWLYGWNGASYDRLQVDVNKSLKAILSAGGNLLTIKAASTPSVATDTSAVFDLNPGGAGYAAITAGTGLPYATAPVSLIYEGCRAATASPATLATDGQLVPAACGAEGKRIILPYANKENALKGTVTMTSSTAAQNISNMAAQGAAVKIYITRAQCGRTDAGATAITLTFNDTASSFVILPVGGASNPAFDPPLEIAANTQATVTSDTSVNLAKCSVQGFKGP